MSHSHLSPFGAGYVTMGYSSQPPSPQAQQQAQQQQQQGPPQIIGSPSVFAASSQDESGSSSSLQSPPPAGAGSKIFVGQVPKNFNETNLRPIFERFGPVVDVMVLRDRITGGHKGCAFVTFQKEEDAFRVMGDLHDKFTLPEGTHPLQIHPAEPGASQTENKLFVGMIPRSVNEDDLRFLFSKYGDIEDMTLLRDYEGVSKGCAFVRYKQRAQSQSAIEALNAKYRYHDSQQELVVRFADTEKQKQQRKMHHQQQQMQQYNQIKQQQINFLVANHLQMPNPNSPVGAIPPPQVPIQLQGPQHGHVLQHFSHHPMSPISSPGFPQPPYSTAYLVHPVDSPQREGPEGSNLFIYHLPNFFTDLDLMSIFAPFGTIMSAKVFIDKVTKQSKCFGFVSYDNPSSAMLAISKMNGFSISGKRLKVQLKTKKDF